MISLVGMLFDAVGGLYLAYDLLGGEKGPLSTFTRAFTYSLLLFIIFAIAMGAKFALCAGIGLGVAVGLQLDRIGRKVEISSKFLLSISLLRACGMGSAVWTLGRPITAGVVSLLIFIASMVLPVFKISPELLVEAGKKPSINKQKVLLACFFGIMALTIDMLFLACGLSSLADMQDLLKLAFTVFLGMLVVGTLSPSIEWYADNVEPKVLGYLGTILFLLGFLIQSIPSWFVVLK